MVNSFICNVCCPLLAAVFSLLLPPTTSACAEAKRVGRRRLGTRLHPSHIALLGSHCEGERSGNRRGLEKRLARPPLGLGTEPAAHIQGWAQLLCCREQSPARAPGRRFHSPDLSLPGTGPCLICLHTEHLIAPGSYRTGSSAGCVSLEPSLLCLTLQSRDGPGATGCIGSARTFALGARCNVPSNF